MPKMMLSFLIVTGACVVFFIKLYRRRSKISKCLKKFNGPKPLPILGNALKLTSKTDLFTNVSKFVEDHGSIVKLWIGPVNLILIIQDVKMIEFLLASTTLFNKSVEYSYLKEWIGNGLLANDGDAGWAKHRKILLPAFHYNVLKKFIPVFTSLCDVLVKILEKEIGNPSFDISTVMKLYSMDGICECAMGTSVNALVDSDCEFVKDVSTVCDVLIQRTFNPLLKPDLLFGFTKQRYIQKKAFKRLNDKVNAVIIDRKHIFHGSGGNHTFDNGADEFGKKQRLAFLDLLLNAAEKDPSITDTHIREEVATFMFAGQDTTQATLSFCLYSLAEDQDIQERLLKEAQEVLGDDQQKPITYSDINKMKYMDAVVKETLRLFPPVPMFARVVDDDLEYDGATLPKGVSLIIYPYGLHRDPKLFDNPSKFDPERFITGGAPKHAFSYIPFSTGPRDCIGKKFAMVEIKVTLAILLRKFKFLPARPKHNLLLVNEVVLVSQTGVHVQIERRSV